jgi:hypothetical protein
MDDPVAIDLVRRAHRVGFLRKIAIGTLPRAGGKFAQ